ncbi:MAG: SDR family NAD(P)-dependent oxidoreductase, partial [Paracoccaceae bacterium]|nr:SDR family NAD(P)-dependent oxidoreductase [Paracoccaceae bacterium]
CAGIIQPFVTFNELADDDIDRVFKVNLTGTLNIVRAFLPVLLTRPSGHLGLVSSMGGFLPFPKQAVYSSSKAAVKVLGEALYAETRDTTVGVSVIMPGAVDTRISENSGVEIAVPEGVEPNALPASDAARIILDGIEADRLHILVGKDARQLWLLTRLMPTRAIGIVQKQMKKLGL